MGITLTGKRVQNTYDSLLKLSDNQNLTGTAKIITDGYGNDSPLYLSTSQFGIGITPAYQFHTSGNAKIGGNLIISGNLTVNGTLTYLNVEDLAVEDPIIKLAKDNTANTLDIGLFGKYVATGTKYKGLFNDASDDKFKLFIGTTVEPTTTVDITASGYTVGTLVANLEGNVTGGTISGTTGTFTGLVSGIAPTADLNFATKKYVDDQTIPTPTLSSVLSAGNTSGANDLKIIDDQKLLLGDDGDMQIYHNQVNSVFFNDTGNIVFRNNANDSDISFQTDDGLGYTTEYLRLDGGDVNVVFSKPVLVNNQVIISNTNAPALALRDSGATGQSANPYLEFAGSDGVRVGYIGMGSAGNSRLYLEGNDGIYTNNPLTVQGALTITTNTAQGVTHTGAINSGLTHTQQNTSDGTNAYTSRVWKNDATGSNFGEIWRNSTNRSSAGQLGSSFNMYNSHDINFWSGGSLTLTLTGNNANFVGSVTGNSFIGPLTGNVTGNVTGGTISGTTGTFSGAISGTNITLSDANAANFTNAATAVFTHTNNATPVAFRMDKGGTGISDSSKFGVLQLQRTNHNNTDTNAGGGLYWRLKDDTGVQREYAGIAGTKTVAGTGGGELLFMNYSRNTIATMNLTAFTHYENIKVGTGTNVLLAHNDNSYVGASTGNFGVGETNPTRGITIKKANQFASLNIIKSGTGNQIVFLGTGSSATTGDLGILQLSDSGSVKAQIYSGGMSYLNGGSLVIGGTTTSAKFEVIGSAKLWNRWNSGTLSDNSFYVQNSTDGFAFGVGTGVSTWFSWDNSAGQKRAIDVFNNGTQILFGAGGAKVTVGDAGLNSALNVRGQSGDSFGNYGYVCLTLEHPDNYPAMVFRHGDNGHLIRHDNNNKLQIVGGADSGTLIKKMQFETNGSVLIGTGVGAFQTATNNTGLTVDTGGHSSIQIGDGVNDGGMIQSSDNSQRIIIGANVYDSPTGSWQRFTADSAALVDVYGEGSGSFISLNVDAGTSGFPTARLVVKNNGYIGMGTDNPGVNLHVKKSGSGTIFRIQQSGANSYAESQWQTPTGNMYIFVNSSTYTSYGGANATNFYSSNGSFNFHTNSGNNLLVVKNDGKTGVNTNSPGAKLDIKGDAGSPASSGTTQNAILRLQNGSNNNTLDIGQVAGSPYGTWIQADDKTSLGTSNVYPIILNPMGGKVGIGRLNPATTLHIQTTAVAGLAHSYYGSLIVENSGESAINIVGTSFSSIYFGDAGSAFSGAIVYNHSSNLLDFRVNTQDTRMKINAGAETVSLFSVDEAGSNYLQFRKNSGAAQGYVGYGGSGDNTLYIVQQSANNIQFYNGSATRMTLTTSGYVGIGQGWTSPTAPLDVKGVRIGRDWNLSGRATIRIDSSSSSHPSDILFADDSAGTQGTWTGVKWSLSSRHGSADNKFYIYRGSGHASPYNSEAVLMTFTKDLKVGINQTSPAYTLDVTGDARFTTQVNAKRYYAQNAASNSWPFMLDTAAHSGTNDSGFWVNSDGTPDMRLRRDSTIVRVLIESSNARNSYFNSGANYGFGITAPASRVDISGKADAFNGWGYVSLTLRNENNYPAMVFRHGNYGTLIRQDNGYNLQIANGTTSGLTKRIQLNHSNGYLAVGNINPGYKLDVEGDIRASSDVIAFSDKRVKENIVTIDNALNKVTKLRGVTYTRKDTDDKSTKVGVIAQEVLEVLPEVVSKDNNGMYSVAYGNIAGVFIEAIKELKAEVDSLKQEIKELKK